MSQISVSAILCNYNHARFLPQALDALLDQPRPADEIIVIDDASTDDSVAVIESYARRAPNLIFRRNERNLGWGASTNRALEIASGDYIYSGAADDRVLPGIFAKALAILQQHPEAGLCCSDPATMEEGSGEVRPNPLRLGDVPCYLPPAQVAKVIRQRNPWLAGHSGLWKRSAVMELGGVDPELRWHGDWAIVYIAALRYGMCYVPEPLALLRVRPDSFSAAGRCRQTEQRAVLEHLLAMLKQPSYEDVLPLFRSSGALYHFAPEIFRILLRHPEHRDLLNGALVDQLARDKTRRALTRLSPEPVRRLYRALRYGKGP